MEQKILIIDDEESILELLTLNLEIYGYKVFTSNTGKGVLEKIIEIQPNIISKRTNGFHVTYFKVSKF